MYILMARRGNSSSAYRLYDSEPAGTVRQAEKRIERTGKKQIAVSQRNKRELPAPVQHDSKIKRGSIRLIGNVLFLCLVAFAVLFRYSAIVERDHKLESLKEECSAITDENKRLQVEIDSVLNLDNVEQIAMNELGMAKPEKYQTVYVNIKGDDYVEMAEEAEEETAGGKQFYATIIQTLGNVLEYLY